MSKTNMLSDNEVLRQIWGGPLQELVVSLNGKRGPEKLKLLNKFNRDELMVIPPSKPYPGVMILKTVPARIGGGRTTDQIVQAAKETDEQIRPTYINDDITQANMPSGYGPERTVLLEFGQFDHSPTTKEVWEWITQPGHGFATYEDGLRFQEAHPDDQREYPHIFIPETPWCDVDGCPRALPLWSRADERRLYLYAYSSANRWLQCSAFARRKYALEPLGK